ncbi:hypothetical protein THUN1656_15760 [Rodentibacter abscessus]|uniref:hypothetical protein n=1 Tax=Rodentibacter abscessus TaxID=3381777 RepID=UPI00399CDCB2
MCNIKREIRQWLEQPENNNAIKRAELIRFILRDCIYDFVKYERPEGMGLDGHNGPERQALAKVVDATEDYYFDTVERIMNIKTSS